MKHAKRDMAQGGRLLALLSALLLLLPACGRAAPADDTADILTDAVMRFAEANPGSGESIAIPGYETLHFTAGGRSQTVNLKNPAENACTFVLTLSLEDGETLWTGETLFPGEAFTRITLRRALNAGEYAATLHYDCYTVEDNQPLNGAEIQLTVAVS